ncbi:Membrane insertion protein, OxaA/YidC, partial [mine drainage metagenome]
MIVASALGQIFQPIFALFADVIAFFYAVIPNYAIAITLLTIVVMAVTAPLTIKGTTSMMAMQRVAPEMKKLQQKYKGDRVKQNEALMALYKEHNVSPVGGCLPLILQLPVFFILYGVIDGLINLGPGKHPKAEPRYVAHSTSLYHHLVLTPGKMTSFGVNLASKALAHHSSIFASLPFWGIVAAAIVAQYFQMSQMNRWNPDAAKANPQTQMMQKYMPII